MGVDRREFLKIAGYAALFGLGGKAAIDILAPGELEASMQEIPLTQGKRWSMVIDMRKCLKQQEKGKDGCKECIIACTASITCRTGAIQNMRLNGSGRTNMSMHFRTTPISLLTRVSDTSPSY